MVWVFTAVVCGVLLCFMLGSWVLGMADRVKKRRALAQRFDLSGRQRKSLGFSGKSNSGKISAPRSSRFRLDGVNYLLITAGISISADRFLVYCLGTGLCVSITLWAMFQSLWLGIAGLLVCIGVPVIYLLVKKKAIEKELVRQMPEALSMVVRALRVGMSVDQALRDTSNSIPAPFGTEIRIIYEEMRMGLSFEQAFTNFEQRYPKLSDVKIFTTAFIIQRETGGSLVQILEGLSQTIKKRFYFQRQIRTFSAEARISGIVIGILPLLFALATYLFNPDYIMRLASNPVGRMFIAAAVVLEIAGFLVMRRMTVIRI